MRKPLKHTAELHDQLLQMFSDQLSKLTFNKSCLDKCWTGIKKGYPELSTTALQTFIPFAMNKDSP